MSNLTDFFPSGSGGGGLTPKFQEFNSSGTFTPSQALIDAGGYIEVFLVAAGNWSNNTGLGGQGGDVKRKIMYLTSTNPIGVTIAGSGSRGSKGGNSSFGGSSAGGINITCIGGDQSVTVSIDRNKQTSSFQRNSFYADGSNNGYGTPGGVAGSGPGVFSGLANTGQGGDYYGSGAGSGYCLIKWYE
jgi:hypothetical protein